MMQNDWVRKELGDLLAVPEGDGLWGRPAVPGKAHYLKVSLCFDQGSIEFYEDHTPEKKILEIAHGRIQVEHDPAAWVAVPGHKFSRINGGIPYTDSGIEKAVKEFLIKLGLPPDCGWSEQGAQMDGVGDFDAGLPLLEAVWPEVFAAAREAMQGQAPIQGVNLAPGG